MAQIGWVDQEGVPTPIIKAIRITGIRERSTARRSQ